MQIIATSKIIYICILLGMHQHCFYSKFVREIIQREAAVQIQIHS